MYARIFVKEYHRTINKNTRKFTAWKKTQEYFLIGLTTDVEKLSYQDTNFCRLELGRIENFEPTSKQKHQIVQSNIVPIEVTK